MVRPREIRAMKAPTYGAQAIQVAKKIPHSPSHDVGSKAHIFRDIGTSPVM